jgi:nuclear pore complex protein Nup62
LAEKLSDRLDEMGKDLTSMIEEINNASSSLSKTSKADDPVSFADFDRFSQYANGFAIF